MRGNVIGFDPDTNSGAISGHDGNRYDFANADWRGQSRPHHGDIVDFSSIGQRAVDIYLVEPEYIQPSFGAFYFSPSGRISRSQYWLRFFLPVFIVSLILNLISLAGEALKILPGLFSLIVWWPGIAVLIKRMHDRNKSGWLVWAAYGPLIVAVIFGIAALVAAFTSSAGAATALGIIAGIFAVVAVGVGIWFFVEFGCMRGTVGANRYGPDPVRLR